MQFLFNTIALFAQVLRHPLSINSYLVSFATLDEANANMASALLLTILSIPLIVIIASLAGSYGFFGGFFTGFAVVLHGLLLWATHLASLRVSELEALAKK